MVPSASLTRRKAEQAGVGVHALREPAEQDRQELALERGAAADSAGEGFDVPHGAAGIEVAQGGEASLRGFRAEPGLLAAERRRGVEQRAVEDAFVQLADGAFGLAPGRDQGVGFGPFAGEGPEHGLGEGPQRGFLDRHEVGAAQLEELDPVFEEPEVAVVAVELGGVGAADVAAGGQRGDGRGGVAAAQGLVGLAVHQLQQLDGEFDVAQPAAAQLDLPLLLLGGDVFGDPAAHGADGLHEAFPAGGGPDQRRDGRLVAGAELRVPGDGPGLEQGLELPALGPAGVVALVRGEGPDQRPGLALRAQVGVDLPQPGFAADGHDGPGNAGGQGRADRVGAGIVQLAGLDHVDDVDVGNVVEFAGAAFAHADDGQPDVGHLGGAEMLGGLGPGDGQGRLDRGAGEIRQFGAGGGHEVQRVRGAEILDGELDEAAPVLRAERHVALLPGQRRDRAAGFRDRPARSAAAGRAVPRRPRPAVPGWRSPRRRRGVRGGGSGTRPAPPRRPAPGTGARCVPVPRPPASAGPGASRSAGPATAAPCPGSRPAAARRTGRPGPGPPVPGRPATVRRSPGR